MAKESKIKSSFISFWKDFKGFAMRGNVVDMAIGVVVGGAFSKIVNSLVNDLIMPVFGAVTGRMSFSDLAITLVPPTDGVANSGVYLKYGGFIETIVNFLIIAFSIFIVVRVAGKLGERRKKEIEASPPPPPPEPSKEELLLTEIRDLLAANNH